MECPRGCNGKRFRDGAVVRDCQEVPQYGSEGFFQESGINELLAQPLSPSSLRKELRRLTQEKCHADGTGPEKIARFIRSNRIEWREAEKCQDDDETPEECARRYETVNEFFARRLHKDARPGLVDNGECRADRSVLAVCDSRLVAFPSLTCARRVWIKARQFSVAEMVHRRPEELPAEVAVAVFRLVPSDYHRFHAPCSGTVESIDAVAGEYHDVRPEALGSDTNVLDENKRVVIRLHNAALGPVYVVVVGATCVASVWLRVAVGRRVACGEEMGRFELGGSTVACVFDSRRIRFCPSLVDLSSRGIETLVRAGERIGQPASTGAEVIGSVHLSSSADQPDPAETEPTAEPAEFDSYEGGSDAATRGVFRYRASDRSLGVTRDALVTVLLQFQVATSDADASPTVYAWLRKKEADAADFVDVPNSTALVRSSGREQSVVLPLLVDLALRAGDRVQFMVASTNPDLAGTRATDESVGDMKIPSSPSAIVVATAYSV